MRTKLARTLVVGVAFGMSSCGGGDTTPTETDGVAGSDGLATGLGGSLASVGGSATGLGGSISGVGGSGIGGALGSGGVGVGGSGIGGAPGSGGAGVGGSGVGGDEVGSGGSGIGGDVVGSGGSGVGGDPGLGGSGVGGDPGLGGDQGLGGDAGHAGDPGTGGDGTGGDGTGGDGTGGDSTLSPGCGTAVTRPDPDVQQTMDINGTTRYYLLNVPENADNQTPLVLIFALHGYDMNNVSLADAYDFTSRSNGQAITVLPQGEGPPPGDVSHWGDGVLNSTWTAGGESYTFIETLKADLEERYCIDTSREFITGFSMGGMFTNSMACDHNDWFRGFAPVEGAGPGSCSDASAQPAIIIHQGTTDDILGPEAGEATRDFWVNQNGCTQTTTPSFTGCETYGGCADGRPVVYCVGSWGHWVDGVAADNIWSFFSGLE